MENSTNDSNNLVSFLQNVLYIFSIMKIVFVKKKKIDNERDI